VLAVTVVIGGTAAPAAVTPSGFTDEVVWTGLTNPTAVRFAPDGRAFVAEKSGLIKVFDGLADPTPTVFADLRTKVHNFWDRGLLGLAIDPSFPTRPYIYVFYTYDAAIGGTAPRWGTAGASSDGCPTPPGPTGDGCVVSGRLSKLEAAGGGNTSTGTEQVLIEDWCQQYPSHSVGTIAFGRDGALYASGGDGASFTFADYGQAGSPRNPCGDPPGGVGSTLTPPTAEGGALRSQDLRTSADPVGLGGSVIRVNPDTGAALPDNPLASNADPNARRIVAYGLRNPFRFSMRPGTDEIWIGDVGWTDWEEINRITDANDSVVENFGWPCYEGNSRQPGYDAANLNVCENLYSQPGATTNPFFAYHHNNRVVAGESCPTGSSSVSGLAFAWYASGPYPAAYEGALFFADYSRNCIWAMKKDANSVPAPGLIETFVAAADAPVDLQIGPTGELFYADFTFGTIHRIRYNAPPPAQEDKALNRPASASSVDLAGHEPAKANDGSSTTRWSSSYANNQWWQVDLGSVRSVDTVRLNWEAAYGSSYQVLTSTDGVSFAVAASDGATAAGWRSTSFAVRSARYVRVLGVTRATPWGFSFWDAQVFGPVEGSSDTTAPSVSLTAPAAGTVSGTVRVAASASDNVGVVGVQFQLDGTNLLAEDLSAPYFVDWDSATSTNGSHTLTAIARDAAGNRTTSTSVAVTVSNGSPPANVPPTATISTPTSSTTWAVGDSVSFSGSASDAEDGALSGSSLQWTLILHHCPSNCHTHQLQAFSGSSGSFTAPDHEYPSHLELRLTATDSAGATATASVLLQPKTATLSFQTAPAGLQLAVGSSSAVAPFSRTVIVGSNNSVSAISPQTQNGRNWTFTSWSDGGAQTHTVTAAAGGGTFTATFADAGPAVAEDKALNKATSASSVDLAGHESSKANDGNSNTRWSSAYRNNEWWQVDLGAARLVDSIRLNWEVAYATAYDVQTSTDGVSFTTAVSDGATAAGWRTTTFAARTARFVRVVGVRRATRWGISFWDAQVFGPSDTVLSMRTLSSGLPPPAERRST
jgi:glucose/arabinose dehydrogenase